MRALWKVLNRPIPALRQRPRVKRAPWILRRCPERWRGIAVPAFSLAGLLAHMLLYVAGLFGIILTPLFAAMQHPDAPVAAPFHWLAANFSPETAIFIYMAVCMGVAGVLTYAIVVSDYLRYDASERKKREIS